MTVLERMAEWISTNSNEALSKNIRERLAIHVLDAVGAWIAGRATAEGQMLARLESSPSLPLSVFLPQPLDRIALGVATTRLTEIDDIHMPSCTTPSSVVVPTALIVAGQLQRRDARTFAQALCAGYETMTRFGEAIDGPSILPHGIWPTYLAAPLCAAAVTARFLNLTAEKTADALGIALTMTSGAPGRPIGASPRWQLLGMAARAGCTAALAAAEGYAGDRNLLDEDWMNRTHGIKCNADPLVAAVQGEGAVAALSLKPYCAAKQTVAAIDAFRNLLEQGISPDEIAFLRVGVPPAYAAMIAHRDVNASRIARITSAAYLLALAAYQPESLDDVARPNLAGDPQIAAFMERVKIVPDEALAQHYPKRWPAWVEAVLKNGRTLTNLVLDSQGDPPRFGEIDARAKFHRLADAAIGRSAADELAEACLAATERDDALAILCAKFNS